MYFYILNTFLICKHTTRKGPVVPIAGKIFADKKIDPDVLSTDHSQHIRKVKQGGYIYILDVTSAHAETSKNCDLISGKASELFVMYYSFALRKNSAYGPAINQM